MGVNTTGLLNTQTEVYASYKNDAVTKNETAAKKDSTAKTEEKNESGVVYDKSDSSKDNKKATYSINKMSAEEAYGEMWQAAESGERITDDAMIVERFTGHKVKLVQGKYENIKVTTPEDLLIAEVFLKKAKKMKNCY